MRGRASNGFQVLRNAVRLLMPAWLLYAVAALLVHPVSLVALLFANAIVMTAISRAIGFDHDTRFVHGLARRGVAYFIAASAYTALVAGLVAMPAWWLMKDGSLVAALGLSGTLMLSLVCLWRIWPAFALPLLWDDAYPHPDERGSWLSTALRRSSAFARHMTGEHDLFFTCGLPASLGLLSLALGALALSGIGGLLSGEMRTVAIAIYAVILAPFAHLLLINRCLHAMLAAARGRRQEAVAEPVAPPGLETERTRIPEGISRVDLDSTLLCAMHSAQTSLALAALERGADPDTTPGPHHRDQRTPLMLAVTLPDLRLLRALIAKGVDVNRAHGGITPLIAATRDSHDGRPDAVTTLLANGAEARTPDAAGNTPLHHAARCAEPIIAALLVDAAVDVNAINAESMTALGVACANANWKVAGFLLEHGAKPDVEHAQPALLCACAVAEDDPSGARLLLKNKARVDARGALERTALMAAALSGHARIIEALLGAGASAELADARGTTALMEAARSGSAAAIHVLGKRKPDVDRVDSGGRSALMIACQSRHAGDDAVRALLALGATRSLAGTDGRRALDHAAAAGRWHIVALLDPTYPLPANLSNLSIEASTAHADHLLDALRFGHWNVANEFVGIVRTWPAAALADLYYDLAEPEHTEARTWLRNHGLEADARRGSGASLLVALIERLPQATQAFTELVAFGAPLGGAGLVARVLAAAPAEPAAMAPLAADLLARGADWCGATNGRQTALHLAVAMGERDLVAAILDRGADPDARDTQGNTPLHLSLRLDHAVAGAVQRLLIAAGANPEIANANGETALGLALARSEPALVQWLNWSGWRLPLRRLRDADLPAAAAEGDLDAVTRLQALGVAIDGEDAHGATALVRAAGAGHAALIVHLLAAGADVAHLTRSGVHCLAAAVGARREAVVRTLLAHGVSPDLPIAGGGSSLLFAAALADERIARALLEAGANPNAADEQGTTALQAAAQGAFESGDTQRSRAMLDLLLRAGARLDARNRHGQDALLVLLGARSQPGTRCDGEHLHQLASYLLERGARVDTQDKRGVSALHACALHGLSGCARLLKAHGAPLDLLDGFGRSAAEVAALLGYVDVATELDGARAEPVPGVRQTLRRPARAPD